MKPHVPGIVTFADHSRPMPWSVTYHAVVMFADVSGFTALCEKYSTMGQSGVDQLTRTLNDYLSALVEGILGSHGDILKFAGDAILAIWRVGRTEELSAETVKVVKCCLDIQEKCGEWNTDLGIKLSVKIGVAAGEMSVTFLGNQEYRHYVELGPAVTAVNAAENFCHSGMIVMSPETFTYCDRNLFETESLEDGKHVRVDAVIPKRQRSYSMPIPNLQLYHMQNERRLSSEAPDGISLLMPSSNRRFSNDVTVPHMLTEVESVVLDDPVWPPTPDLTDEPMLSKVVAPMKGVAKAKINLGSRFGKLRKVVNTVTEMRLDIALRLYILPPVLKKIDDDQPLAYLSEMRQVSIVFINLVLDQDLNQELLLQQIFETVYAKSKSMHGSLNKVFLFDKGCTFLVIFGLPGYKHENDCMHALTCSGVMKCLLGQINGVNCVSIGVTTGTTFCGVVGHPNRHEYSVIGRKVNMAARLMMHYPDKITCDTDTFQTCRLPPSFFSVLVTKRMKGLRNVGVIREFVGFSKDEKRTAKSITRSDYPLLGRQLEETLFRQQIKTMIEGTKNRCHLIFNGPSGIGKTKLLDKLITIAQENNFKVISCAVEPEDSSMPYFIANHVLRTMLSNNGFSAEIDREPFILDAVEETDSMYFYLLNDVMELKIEKPISLIGHSINETQKRKDLLYKISKACLVAVRDTVIVIDDAHNMDSSTWEFINQLRPIDEALIVLGLRPSVIETPSCPDSQLFVDSDDVKMVDMSSLDLNYMAPLACQMMDVVSVPKDLDKLLRERSHGVPSWCMEILKDMIDQKQLIVVLDDGRPQYHQSVVAPNKTLIKPLSAMSPKGLTSDTRIMHKLNVQVTEVPRDITDKSTHLGKVNVSGLGYVHDSLGLPVRRNTLSVGPINTQNLAAGGALNIGLTLLEDSSHQPLLAPRIEKPEGDRIAIFAAGISSKDIPVPDSMKELIVARLDSMRASDQLMVKCAAVLGKTVRRDILEMLLPKAHRPKLARTIRRLMESGIFQCSSLKSCHGPRINYGKDDPSQVKYRCVCHKDDIQTRYGEPETCFEPMFTNHLLQQTAYEILMESQRFELHSKAASYFEVAANEIRSVIPYYYLYRPPGENLQEELRQLEASDAFPLRRTRRRKKVQITDEVFSSQAATIAARRGRRLAVSLTASETFLLVTKILTGATPMEPIEPLIARLLPLYTSLCHHWTAANQPVVVFFTLLEAVAACLTVRKTATGREYMARIEKLLETKTTGLDPDLNPTEYQVILARVERLKGKLLFQSGQTSSALVCMARAAHILDLKLPTGHRVPLSTMRLVAKFYWNRSHPPRTKRQVSSITLEKGYLLSDLYSMMTSLGDTSRKFLYALIQFNKVHRRNMHLHQVIVSFTAMIKCCRERAWVDTAFKLEQDLLACCAVRSEEMSADDRSQLGCICASSCIHSFLLGRLDKASISGKTAAEITLCVQDLDTIKTFVPYFFFLCLMQNEYLNCVNLLEKLRYAGCMTQDNRARTLYYVLCLEVAMAGGCPPESVQACICGITNYMKTGDVSIGDMASRYYVAMTTALWCAKRGKWRNMQTWFDFWETYEARTDNFFSLLGRANKLECMLLSLSTSISIGNTKVADALETTILHDFCEASRVNHSSPVLKSRFLHLEAYYHSILGQNVCSSHYSRRALARACNHGNKMEARWIEHNLATWRSKSRHQCVRNQAWNQSVNRHHMNWRLAASCKPQPTLFMLVLPTTNKS